MQDAVILSATRTPIGSFMGSLSSVSAPQLGAAAIRAAVERAGVDAAEIQQTIMGNVLQSGQGQAPARQASIYSGLPKSVGAITLNKVCGSGLRAVIDAGNAIRLGDWEAVVAGGMESMSNAPHLLEKSRGGYRMGDVKLADSMIKDGLWDPYDNKHMGMCGETCASKYEFSREIQDAFALESYKRARAAVEAGWFDDEIVSVQVPQRKGDALWVERDDEPFGAPLEKMASLRPAFDKNGTITAANASKINDGASALVVASDAYAKKIGRRPLVRIVAHATYAHEPEWFTTAPVEAVRRVLQRAALRVADIDRWEINEAFAVVTLAAIRDLGLDAARVNARGGAVSLGHPIGCSGARILTTLIHTLVQEKLRYGCAAICIGGGEALALVVENPNV